MHSDAEGFYVPIDFEQALVAADIPLLGGTSGSTQRLLSECNERAGTLGVPAELHWEAEELTDAIETPSPTCLAISVARTTPGFSGASRRTDAAEFS